MVHFNETCIHRAICPRFFFSAYENGEKFNNNLDTSAGEIEHVGHPPEIQCH